MREWIGVKFCYGGYSKSGCDCLGLIIGSLLLCDSSHTVVQRLCQYRKACRNIIDGSSIVDGLRDVYTNIDLNKARSGDLVLFAMSHRLSRHVAVISTVEPSNMIHAYGIVGQVVENSIDHYWHSKIITCIRLHF